VLEEKLVFTGRDSIIIQVKLNKKFFYEYSQYGSLEFVVWRVHFVIILDCLYHCNIIFLRICNTL